MKQRKFVNEVRRADEMERKLKFLETEIKKDGIKMHEGADSPDAPPPREMSDLESTFEKLEQELQEVSFLLLYSQSCFNMIKAIIGKHDR